MNRPRIFSELGHKVRIYSLAFLVIQLSACSSHPDNAQPGTIIADLPDVPLPKSSENTFQAISTDDIINSYLDVLEITEEKRVRRQIETRLADLEMIRSEDQLVNGSAASHLFQKPIKMYEDLLSDPEEGQNSERLLYQLSKAYALEGRDEESSASLQRLIDQYPQSKFASESEFRLAERAFSNGNYEAAKDHYAAVAALGDASDFYQNAIYMKGWSEFKLNRYPPALTSFLELLDLVLANQTDLTGLNNTQKNLAEDTLRVSAIAFSYLGGASSIEEAMSVLGERPYRAVLYESLGTLYENQERYRDAADTYLAFVDNNPMSSQAPAFNIKAIQTYYDGNFPSLIRPAKETFVEDYAVNSPYWKQANRKTRVDLQPVLKEYLLELASFQYALGQKLEPIASEFEQREAFLQAAEYYSQFVETDPNDPEAPKAAFLVGEAYFAAKAYAGAANAYERSAYDIQAPEYAADAGYNLVLALDAQIESLSDFDVPTIREKKVQSSVRYAETYPNDARALPVLAEASDTLFKNGETRRATQLAESIVFWRPSAPTDIAIKAWLIIGHGNFELNRFLDAETAYRELLTILPENDARIATTQDQLAATLYRQSEQLISSGQTQQAINKLLAVRDSAPHSDIAATAHFDAANYLIELKDWSRAATELTNFSTYYPENTLSKQVPAKLALVYQELEQWDKAADALQAMASTESNPEARQQAQLLSAELYVKAEQPGRAIQAYERYANTYPEPKALAMEAYFQLAELHTGDQGQRNRWLNTMIQRADTSDKRAQYLGAWASTELAEQSYQSFDRIALRLPLRDSLKLKQHAMKTSLQAYNQVLEFGVAEFTTNASYRIGEIYAELSTAMMDSERPAELDALALEQYEILLEEQAFPFEEKAIEIHETNVKRSWSGTYNDGIKGSFLALGRLLPARYNKVESRAEASLGIH